MPPFTLPPVRDPSTCEPWQALARRAADPGLAELPALFDQEPERFARWSMRCGDLLADFSKQRLDDDIHQNLLQLAQAMALPAWRDALFSGAPVNHTESRAAMHWALRSAPEDLLSLAPPIAAQINAARPQFQSLAERLRARRWLGATGKPLRRLINLGIGGSDLGPRLVCDALAAWADPDLRAFFVANVDPAELGRVLQQTAAEETLFIVTSKTFTTQETRRNAESARDWLRQQLGDDADIGRHFLAVTANVDAATAFGVAREQVLPMWDWVGGRYSVWSAVGFSIAALLGNDAFQQLLQGAARVDDHFRRAPLAHNLPVNLALVGVWNRNFLGFAEQAVVPYARGLERFADYLQQLEMESNGKGRRRDGVPVTYATCPVVWGTVGTSGQHAYFQWLHQGTSGAPVDFILVAQGEQELAEHQEILLANGLAQAQALMQGKSVAAALTEQPQDPTLAAHRSFPGGRPSTTLLLPRLDPQGLGQLLALYEHKTFAQAVLWGINPFDQWGVELGKSLAGPILDALRGGAEPAALDCSTRGLLRAIRALRQAAGRA